MPNKPRRRRSRPRRRYSWALHFPETHPQARRLSGEARRGLEYARALAENARERSRAALRRETVYPVTVEELARDDWTSPIAVHKAIKQARIALFGKDLSDAAIYYRLRRERKRGTLTGRICQEKDCDRPLPFGATARRRFCLRHAGGVARVQRHRRRRRAGGSGSR